MRKLSKKAKRLIIDYSSAAADLTNKAIRPNFIQFGEARAALMDYITELEAERRWVPVSEPPKECEMRVFKDGDAWCFVLPDFQDLQVSPSVWMKKGALDKIYKELRSVRDE